MCCRPRWRDRSTWFHEPRIFSGCKLFPSRNHAVERHRVGVSSRVGQAARRSPSKKTTHCPVAPVRLRNISLGIGWMILKKAFGSATKRHKRRKGVASRKRCLAMKAFPQPGEKSASWFGEFSLCFVLRVPFGGHSTAGFRFIRIHAVGIQRQGVHPPQCGYGGRAKPPRRQAGTKKSQSVGGVLTPTNQCRQYRNGNVFNSFAASHLCVFALKVFGIVPV